MSELRLDLEYKGFVLSTLKKYGFLAIKIQRWSGKCPGRGRKLFLSYHLLLISDYYAPTIQIWMIVCNDNKMGMI